MAAASSFSFRPEDHGENATIFCVGSLTLEHSERLKIEGKKWIPGRKQLALDLAGVQRMDSSGIGVIIGLYISAKKQNCELVLVNYGDSIRELLGMTHLLSVFEAHGRSGTRLP